MALPTPAQIALALAITKSKPIDVSFAEYFLQIRAIIVEGSRQDPIEDQQYIDGVQFWKQAYDRCEIEKNELQGRVFELEQQLRQKAAAESADTTESQKRINEDTMSKQSAKANTQSKRRKVGVNTSPQRFAESGPILDIDQAPTSCQMLLRCLYSLHRLRDDTQATRQDVCQKIRLCCHTAADVVRMASQSTALPSSCNPSDANNTFEIINHTWNTILCVCDRLPATSESAQGIQFVPDMVYLLQTLLGQLHQLSLDEADRRLKATRSLTARRSSQPIFSRTKVQGPPDYTKSCTLIMTTMQIMFQGLRKSDRIQQDIFAGLMCTLLDHLGSCLSLLVFADDQSSKTPDLGLLAPQGLVDVSHIEMDTARLTTTIAAPFLIPVLRQAMAASINFPAVLSSDGSQPQPNYDSGTNDLMINTRIRLQETLLRGVYGNDDQNFDSAFVRAVEVMPLQRNECDAISSLAEDNPDWFIGQIWEHVGWDVLAAKLSVTNDMSN